VRRHHDRRDAEASDAKAEPDTEADPARVDSREPGGTYVGRIAGEDEDTAEESGAERRAAAEEDDPRSSR